MIFHRRPVIREKQKDLLLIFSASVFGLLVFLGIYGMEPLRVSGTGWILEGFGGDDILQHQTGWMFFRNSPWSFPLGKAQDLGYPQGTAISFTDSIPIVSLFFKCFNAILPEHFQFFGLFAACCFALQAVFAFLLVRHFTKNRLFALLSSLLFVLSSGMIERTFRHTALGAHWLFLAGLWLYFSSGNHLVFSVLLNCIALGIHPYLFVPVFALTLIKEIRGLRTGGSGREVLLHCGLYLAASLLFGYSIGIFGSGGIDPSPGFGIYSLNLNALLNPATNLTERWSAFLPPLPRTEAQQDGSFYFGAAAFAALLFCLIFRRKALRKSLAAYPELSILLAGCTLYALSTRLSFGTNTIELIPIPQALMKLLNTFRSGSRFFYLPYYVLYLWIAVSIFRIGRKKTCYALLSCLLILQVLDIAPGLSALHRHFSQRVSLPELNTLWDQAAEYDQLRTFENLTHRPLAFWTAQQKMKTNMMISAPVHLNQYFQDTREERETLYQNLLDGKPLDPDTLYVISTQTGENRLIETPEELDQLLDQLRVHYKKTASLEYVTNGYHNYWLLMPNH